MRKKSPPYPIIFAVILAVVGLVALYQYSLQQENRRRQEEANLQSRMQAQIDQMKSDEASRAKVQVTEVQTDMRKVLYAARPLKAGQKVEPAYFTVKLTPASILKDAYIDTDEPDLLGSYVVHDIDTDEPFTNKNLSKSLPYLSMRIPPGMRAMSIPVLGGDGNATGGFAIDGDRVDLLLTYPSPDNPKTSAERIVLQNLQILYVPGPNDALRNNQTGGLQAQQPVATITFEVTPEEATLLALLQATPNTQFRMILRGKNDDNTFRAKTFSSTDVMDSLGKVQNQTDVSLQRVKELAAEIQQKEAEQTGQTNATVSTPPNP